MYHKFTVTEQPVPYSRVTQKSKFVSKQWQRYADYKAKVVAAFLNTITDDAEKRKFIYNYSVHGKPINTGNQKVYVLSVAYFKNKVHGDSDNINKGILDSLFVFDKYVVGAFDFGYDADNPRLEITICDNIVDWKPVLRKVEWLQN